MIRLIATVGVNMEVGKCGKRLWEIPEEREFFKSMVENKLLFMGRKTFDTLPNFLKNAQSVVLTNSTRAKNRLGRGTVCNTPDEMRLLAEKLTERHEVWIIGGQSLYELFIDVADELVLTRVSAVDKDADAFFPDFDRSNYVVKKLGGGIHEGLGYEHSQFTKITYKLKNSLK